MIELIPLGMVIWGLFKRIELANMMEKLPPGSNGSILL